MRTKTYGCGSYNASSSLVTRVASGSALPYYAAIKNSEIAEEFGKSPPSESSLFYSCWRCNQSSSCGLQKEALIVFAAIHSIISNIWEHPLCSPECLQFGIKHASVTVVYGHHHDRDGGKPSLQAFLDNRGKGIGLRLAVKTTGCSGMAYVLEFVDELNEEDQVFEHSGVKVIIDPKELSLPRRYGAWLRKRRPKRRFWIQQP